MRRQPGYRQIDRSRQIDKSQQIESFIAGLKTRVRHSLFARDWVKQPAQATLEDGFSWSFDVYHHVDARRNLPLRASKKLQAEYQYLH